MKTKRCINLDWFEIHCYEPAGMPHNAEYFRKAGLIVNEREYGTRVYKEMFTICTQDGAPFVEVRRNPFSVGVNGIHTPDECHLRLFNAACYYDNAVTLLSRFLQTYDYTFNRISRVDICMDFEKFDSGDLPSNFVRRYFKHVYAKINQGNINAHGSDTWDGQEWNSLSWGASTSDIGTKFYNKTMELYDPSTDSYRKPHIRYAWFCCGLIDDFHRCTRTMPDGTQITPDIWRLEFSIRSSVKKWFAIELNGKRKAYQSIKNTLDMYDSRAKLLTLFASLCNHYFHFKYVMKRYDFYKSGSTEGKAIRKDRCPDKMLFDFKGQQITYKVGRDDAQKLLGEGREYEKPIDTLLKKLRYFAATHSRTDIHDAAKVLIDYLENEVYRADLQNPWSHQDLLVLQQALSMKAEGNSEDVTIIMRELKALLKLNDNTAIF